MSDHKNRKRLRDNKLDGVSTFKQHQFLAFMHACWLTPASNAVQDGVQPNVRTYTALLIALGNAGEWERLSDLLQRMQQEQWLR